jgi:hypothetical protein
MRERLARLKERFSVLISEYGPVAFTIYFVLFGLSLAGFAVAFRFGFEGFSSRGVTGGLGLVAASWAATKVIQPLRILATLALTPPIGRWFKARQVAGSTKL